MNYSESRDVKWNFNLMDDCFGSTDMPQRNDDSGIKVCGYGSMQYAHSSGRIPKCVKPLLEEVLKEAKEDFENEHKVLLDSLEWGNDDELLEAYCGIEEALLSQESNEYFYNIYAVPCNDENNHPAIMVCAWMNLRLAYMAADVPYHVGSVIRGFPSSFLASHVESGAIWVKVVTLKALRHNEVNTFDIANEAASALEGM